MRSFWISSFSFDSLRSRCAGGLRRSLGRLRVSVKAIELLTTLKASQATADAALKPPSLRNLLETHIAKLKGKPTPTFPVQARAAALQDQLGRPVRIGCLGLAFKPDVDDLRESPALHITTELLLAGLDVRACEPNLSNHSTIKLYELEQVLAEADLLVFLVAHSPFKDLDLSGFAVLDLCGVTVQG